MLESLLPYYEKELTHMQSKAAAFGRRYPKIAGRLLMDGDQIEDPHVKRIIESFSFLAARIHRRMDDNFSILSKAMLEVLFPQAIQPFSSCTIIQFEPDWKKPELTEPYTIPRGEIILSPEVDGQRCKFQTRYPVTIAPILPPVASWTTPLVSSILTKVSPRTTFALKVEIGALGATKLNECNLPFLRFFIDTNPALAQYLYQILLNKVTHIVIADLDGKHLHTLAADTMKPVGFSKEDRLRSVDENSHSALNLLQEYFVLPEKFLFVDLGAPDKPLPPLPEKGALLYFCFEHAYNAEESGKLGTLNGKNWLRINCTPAINQFTQAADPIKLSHRQSAYPVTINGKQSQHFEIVQLNHVSYVARGESGQTHKLVPPLYSVGTCSNPSENMFWYAEREQSIRDDDAGTDMALFLVDRALKDIRPSSEVLVIEAECNNRDLPARIPFGGSDGGTHTDFLLPKHGVVKRTRLLRKPSKTLRPPIDNEIFWRMVSQLSLNYMSLVNSGEKTLHEILRLHDWQNSSASKNQIFAIKSIQSAPDYARIGDLLSGGMVRGTRITITLDNTGFVGGSWFLFGQILSRFFGLYTPINTFTRLEIKLTQQEGIAHQWTAQYGHRHLI